jgi:tetratricopeptide (TPR) repeat protein
MPDLNDNPSINEENFLSEIDKLNKEAWALRQHFDDALAKAERANRLATESSHISGIAESLRILGWLYCQKGEFEQGLNALQQALVKFEQLGDKFNLCLVWGNIGSIHYSKSQYDEALQCYEKSFEYATLDKPIADLLNNIGSCYWKKADYKKAIRFFQKSAAQYAIAGVPEGEAMSINNIGGIYESLGDYDRAIEWFYKSLDVAKRNGVKQGEAGALSNIGSVLEHLGQPQKAVDCFEQAKSIFAEIGYERGVMIINTNLAAILIESNQLEEAESYIKTALVYWQKVDEKEITAQALQTLGNCHQKNKHYEKAEQAYQDALHIQIRIGDKLGEIKSRLLLADLQIRRKSIPNDIEAHLAFLSEEIQKLKLNAQAITVENLRFQLYEQRGDFSRALEHYKKYHELKEQVFNEESDKRMKNLQVLHDVEQARLSERAAIRSKLHSDVLSAITRIHRWSMPLRESLDNIPEELRESVELIYETSKALDVKVRHFQFGLSEKASSVFEVCKHLEKMSREILENKASLNVSGINAAMREIEMDATARDAATDIAQLAMTNIWKHAGAAQVSLRFDIKDNQFEMEIRDDGKGFNVEDAPSIGGVSDMKELAVRVGGRLNIESKLKTPSEAGGTTISFSLNLNAQKKNKTFLE